MIASLATASETNDTLFVCLTNGCVDAYPMQYVQTIDTSKSYTTVLTLVNDSTVTYASTEYDSLSYHGPALPTITSFKFNDKFNEQLIDDADGVIDGNNITVEVAAIGKNLTPSFKTSDDRARVHIDGIEQTSKVSRQRFADDVTYTVSLPGNRLFTRTLVNDEIWSEPQDEGWVDVALTADGLSTNMPSNYPDSEGLFTLLDGDPATYFQSTWGSGAYTQKSEYAYIDIALPYSLKEFRFVIQGRDIGSYNATKIDVYTSENGSSWTHATQVTTADGLPTGGGGQSFTSDAICSNIAFNYIRLKVTEAEHYKKQSDGFLLYYISWAELRIQEYHATHEDPQLLQPAIYSYGMKPYGNDYNVHVRWLADEQTCVPCIEITTDNGRMPDHNKSNKAADKLLWQTAHFKLTGNGMYEDMEEDILIKGRGNSSWAGTTGKSPYNIKFYEKKKPFGLTNGKNWVLLANKQTNSMLSNAIGMKAARLVDATCANHIIPVDLYINGDYRGSYNFTEKVGISNNSVDIDETTGVLIELDSYYDETYRYTSAPLSQPVNIKDPDLSEEPFASLASEYMAGYKKDFNAFCNAIRNSSGYEEMMDVESFARFLMVNDLILNWEIAHPKSTYIFKEETGNADAPFRFGPIWDLDWGYGYEESSSYYLTNAKSSIFAKTGSGWVGTNFFKPLLQNSDIVKKEYYRVWYNFTQKGGLDELLDYVQDYFDYAEPSLIKNANKWGDGNNYEATLPNIRKWLTTRATHIMDNIEVYNLEEDNPQRYGDINGDGLLTAADVVCLLNYILGIVDDDFDFTRADLDASNEISINDLVLVICAVLNEGGKATPRRQQAATMQFVLADFEAPLGEECKTALAVAPMEDEGTGTFTACEYTLTLPEGMMLVHATAAPACMLSTHAIDERHIRMLVYSPDGHPLPTGDPFATLTLQANGIAESEDPRLTFTQANIVTPGGDEQRLHTASATVTFTTGLSNELSTFRAVGGDDLTIHALDDMHIDIFAADGRLVRSCAVSAGTTHIALPNGIYIVGGTKVVIK